MERVAGNALAIQALPELAQVHLERACRTFDLIGHTVGKQRTTNGDSNRQILKCSDDGLGFTWCLDRVRALFDLRARPELMGHEAALLLQRIELCTNHNSRTRAG